MFLQRFLKNRFITKLGLPLFFAVCIAMYASAGSVLNAVDSDEDGDVDGSDIASFNVSANSLEDVASLFGEINVRVEVLPLEQIIRPGESFLFTAALYANDILQITTDTLWFSSGTGIIDSNGEFSAVATGEYEIIALINGIAGKATAKVGSGDTLIDIFGKAERKTFHNDIHIEGVAINPDSGIEAVYVESDRYQDTYFDLSIRENGFFEGDVPLRGGENNLRVIAKNKSGKETENSIVVFYEISELPVITIHAPPNGSIVLDEWVAVSGSVISSLEPEKVRLLLNDQIIFPEGTEHEYQFAFDKVRLIEGPNTLTVKSETLYGETYADTTVIYNPNPDQEVPDYPVIEILSEQKDMHVSGDTVIISGVVKSNIGIKTVQVNSETVDFVGSAERFSFIKEFVLSGNLEVTVEATDVNNKISTKSFTVYHDNIPPVIHVTSPGIVLDSLNSVLNTPFNVTGIITEANLAGVSINNQDTGVTPFASSEWLIDVDISLVRSETVPIVINAWDYAGNTTSSEFDLKLNGLYNVTIVSPSGDTDLYSNDTTIDVEIVIKVPGVNETDTVIIFVDDTEISGLTRSGDNINGVATIDAAEGERKIKVIVKDNTDNILIEKESAFSIINTMNTPLEIIRVEPENNAEGIEPNAFIGIYFNKEIDPSLLKVTVNETAHGKVYDLPEKGADLSSLSKIELVDVHKDFAPVEGGISHFPEKTMCAFYPTSDFSYTGTVYVSIEYEGIEQPLSKWSFKIRPIPTFVQGIILGQDNRPIEGIEVEILELKRKVKTDINGNYGFGFGDSAKNSMPGGRYSLLVNPEKANTIYGSIEKWVKVEENRLNRAGVARLVPLDMKEPYRRIKSNQVEPAILAGGNLELDINNVSFRFKNSKNFGDVHTQFVKFDEIPYPSVPYATSSGAYLIQPIGIFVDGEIEMVLKAGKLNGNYSYLENVGDRVILLGLDPEKFIMVPIGVGVIDAELGEILSEGQVHLKRLDAIGYAFVNIEFQPLLENYGNDEIALEQLISGLQ